MARHCILLSSLCIEGESKVLVRCTIALPHVMGRGAPLQESFQTGPARQIRRPRFCVRRLDSRHAETGDVLPGVCSRRGSRLTKARSYRPASASCRELCRPGSVSARRPRLPASAHQPQAASPRGGQCYPAFASIRGPRRSASAFRRGPPRPAPGSTRVSRCSASAPARGPRRTVSASIRSPCRPASARHFHCVQRRLTLDKLNVQVSW